MFPWLRVKSFLNDRRWVCDSPQWRAAPFPPPWPFTLSDPLSPPPWCPDSCNPLSAVLREKHFISGCHNKQDSCCAPYGFCPCTIESPINFEGGHLFQKFAYQSGKIEAKPENYASRLDLKYSSGEKIAWLVLLLLPSPYAKPDLSLLHCNPLLLPLYSSSWIICIVLGLIPARGLLCWRMCLQSQDQCHTEL